MDEKKREKEIYKTTVVGAGVNVALLVFKFVAGVVAGSAAMIADAVHSLSDFITDVIVVIFVRLSNKPQDRDHEYGHGKYETLATTAIGAILMLVAFGILYNGIGKIVLWAKGGTLPSPGWLAFWAAIASIVLKELTYWYTIFKAKKVDSSALRANAWHHRSDALSSVGTAIGIGGAIMLGERWTVLDPIASVVVGIVIVKVSIDLIRNGIDELMEHSLPKEVEDEILSIVSSFDDVSDPHELRTRRIGNHYAIDLHFRMDGDITLSRAHSRSSDIERLLKDKYGPQTIVSLHIEPIGEQED